VLVHITNDTCSHLSLEITAALGYNAIIREWIAVSDTVYSH
jgi:hypothetical protein